MPAIRADVVILGAGPTGCAAALAFSRAGREVLLLEADPRRHDRISLEWIHPVALSMLQKLGVELEPPRPFPTGRGWALLPDDGSEPIVLPYPAGSQGMALPHDVLVETLREHAARAPGVRYVPWARATRVEGKAVSYERRAQGGRVDVATVDAELVVGATGRDRTAFATEAVHAMPCSRLVGFVLRDAGELPFEGFQHIAPGGSGPVVLHRLSPREIRVVLDVPMRVALPAAGTEARAILLEETYGSMIPEPLRPAFRRALRAGDVEVCPNIVSPRQDLDRRGPLGTSRLALAGDALGVPPPLTSLGLVLALLDVEALVSCDSLADYARQRLRNSRVPELIAFALYEVLADSSPSSAAVRAAVFRMLRAHPEERLETMALVSGQNPSRLAFGRSFAAMLLRGARDLVVGSVRSGRIADAARLALETSERLGWLLGGTLGLTDAVAGAGPRSAEERYGAALRAARSSAEVVGLDLPSKRVSAHAPIATADALERAVRALLDEQAEDGSFEGEVVWCAMLPAQYVLAMHVLGRPISELRRKRLLRQFEHTRDAQGTWGLHRVSEPYLFVTVLVYVAARLLGIEPNDPLLEPARRMLEREGGAVAVPSWGKLWLALVGLYEWDGVPPVLPEIWSLPTSAPIHPSRYYCHTRNIYLAMAVLYGERVVARPDARILALREELFPGGYANVDWTRARTTLRAADLHAPPSPALRAIFTACALFDRTFASPSSAPGPRQRTLAELREQIRYEMRSTHYTCISPVSGLLGMIALHAADPDDPDLARALDAFEGWIWEDDEDGLRVAGARSASWDTAFALQALSAARAHVVPHARLEAAMHQADGFLASQQVTERTGREAEHFRLDPRGGWCFAGVWHGWPVSDCTAEAVLARLSLPEPAIGQPELTRAVEFILRTQCSDGGFGSYEARRVDLPLEWMNPAEMFGDSMTEKSYVECTASCIAALAAVRRKRPGILADAVETAIHRAAACLRRAQELDGSWLGVWGVHRIYGTMFGIRGLRAAGAPPHDSAIRRACAFLLSRQRPDGGWGEHFSSIAAGRYVEHPEGQVVQTAWALTALLEAEEPDFAALERAARFLVQAQASDGTYPRQDPEGLFFHTALLDYELYRRYFPVWALGLFEDRARQRARRSTIESDRRAHPA